MTRSFDASSIVQLPRFDAAGAVALGRELLNHAEHSKKKPPTAIAKKRDRLAAAVDALEGKLEDRLRVAPGDPKRAREIDHAVDAAWSAFFGWLTGWSRLASPESKKAEPVLRELFGDGLKFTRLALLGGAHEKAVQELGGASFLKVLHATHKAYGDVLGLTSKPQAATPSPKIIDELQATATAMRSDVAAVVGQIDEEDPATTELYEALLAPLATWESTSATKSPSAVVVDPPAPALTH